MRHSTVIGEFDADDSDGPASLYNVTVALVSADHSVHIPSLPSSSSSN